jgi:hypothetical protein
LKSHLVEFTERKLSLASRLADGRVEGGSYGDGILIISSVLAAAAAQLWPGERIDKHRFVELWNSYDDPNGKRNLVSVPLLMQDLEEQDAGSAEALAESNPKLLRAVPGLPNDYVITGADVDLDERQILRRCPGLDVRLIRHHSYAAIFYKEVRSAYVHEYRAGDAASAHRMAWDEGVVSYTNVISAPHRRIHFPIPWLGEVTRSVVEAIAPLWDSAPLPRPNGWWLSG